MRHRAAPVVIAAALTALDLDGDGGGGGRALKVQLHIAGGRGREVGGCGGGADSAEALGAQLIDLVDRRVCASSGTAAAKPQRVRRQTAQAEQACLSLLDLSAERCFAQTCQESQT